MLRAMYVSDVQSSELAPSTSISPESPFAHLHDAYFLQGAVDWSLCEYFAGPHGGDMRIFLMRYGNQTAQQRAATIARATPNPKIMPGWRSGTDTINGVRVDWVMPAPGGTTASGYQGRSGAIVYGSITPLHEIEALCARLVKYVDSSAP